MSHENWGLVGQAAAAFNDKQLCELPAVYSSLPIAKLGHAAGMASNDDAINRLRVLVRASR